MEKQQQQQHQHQQAFTLIELSIVVVVISLIVAGVVAGQALVENAKKRQLINVINMLDVATNSFKLKYNAYPGDIPNASAFWAGARDGNNNQIIERTTNSSTNNEDVNFFNHLSLANMVPGTYVGGAYNTYGYRYFPGYNMVSSPLGNGNIPIAAQLTTYTIGKMLSIFGGDAKVRTFSVKTVKDLDDKIDDGRPLYGKFGAYNGYTSATSATRNAPYCLTVTSVADAVNAYYDLTTVGEACYINIPIFGKL